MKNYLLFIEKTQKEKKQNEKDFILLNKNKNKMNKNEYLKQLENLLNKRNEIDLNYFKNFSILLNR